MVESVESREEELGEGGVGVGAMSSESEGGDEGKRKGTEGASILFYYRI